MACRLRLLPAEEFDRLRAVPMGQQERLPDPAHSLVLVYEVDGEIVGTWAAFDTIMLDGLWVHPDHRGGPAAGRMALALLAELRERGVAGCATLTEIPSVQVQAEKLGFHPLPGTFLQKRF